MISDYPHYTLTTLIFKSDIMILAVFLIFIDMILSKKRKEVCIGSFTIVNSLMEYFLIKLKTASRKN